MCLLYQTLVETDCPSPEFLLASQEADPARKVLRIEGGPMKHDNQVPTAKQEPYEKPVLLDLEEVVAGCGFCATGGSNAIDDAE